MLRAPDRGKEMRHTSTETGCNEALVPACVGFSSSGVCPQPPLCSSARWVPSST